MPPDDQTPEERIADALQKQNQLLQRLNDSLPLTEADAARNIREGFAEADSDPRRRLRERAERRRASQADAEREKVHRLRSQGARIRPERERGDDGPDAA
jgi:hypothetical protein